MVRKLSSRMYYISVVAGILFLDGLPTSPRWTNFREGKLIVSCFAILMRIRHLTIIVDILLSLVRTRSVGHLRDIRRLIVALSRSRLGLYVFCRSSLFENCFELCESFQRLRGLATDFANSRKDSGIARQLQLVGAEYYPASRTVCLSKLLPLVTELT